mmetsp:Transcript_31743/g.61427  ORF Transcript_31743/g.61427 Transcript_31743/m.61427 type:complete len:222 (+) Transcript_31743:45-710(+)
MPARDKRERDRDSSRSDSGREKRPRGGGINDDKWRRGEEVGKESDIRPDWGSDKKDEAEKKEEIAKPNYGSSGKLEKSRQIKKNGIVLKHSEPPNAAIPNRRWRIYVFKNDEIISTLHIHRQSCFIIGRESRVADIRTDHLTCSKQHAVIQFKYKSKVDEGGNTITQICPYIMDLKSANGTKLNKQPIEPLRYYELLEKDLLNFGSSSRDYVILVADEKDE